MGMFETVDEYINTCTLSELNELSEIIIKRKRTMRDKQKKELAVKLKEAFDAYSNVSTDCEDLTVEIEITDNNGYTTTYSVKLAEAVVTGQNNVVFKADRLDINDY